jgi:hypothetical protein
VLNAIFRSELTGGRARAERYSHPRSPNAERSVPGGAYHPPAWATPIPCGSRRGLDEARCEEGQRDRHVDVAFAAGLPWRSRRASQRRPRSQTATAGRVIAVTSFLRVRLLARAHSGNPPFGCDGVWRRHNRSPAMDRKPAGQDSTELFAPGTVTVPAPFAVESQFFSGSSCCWFQAERIMVRSASRPNGKRPVRSRARNRHIAVRILAPQPATGVSRRDSPAL